MSLVSPPPPVLDPCCGSRKFYFDKTAPYVLYGDVRDESYVQCDGRILEVHPDVQMDVTNLPFEDESFALVVFDPPHLKPLEHAIATYFKMMRELYRSEHEFARREADNLNLTKALQDVARGGVAVVAPDETDEEVSRCGVQGVAYVHGRCEPGYLVREDGQNFWMIPERETFVRITEPTLMFFLEEKPSYANTIRSQNQDHPN